MAVTIIGVFWFVNVAWSFVQLAQTLHGAALAFRELGVYAGGLIVLTVVAMALLWSPATSRWMAKHEC